MEPICSLSLDLDNQWSYMKTHGDPGWEEFPSYFDIFIPDVLDILDRFNLKITFFVVGQDAALDKNRDTIRLLIERGHEVGNHSFHHEPWLHTYTKERVKREVLDAEEQILKVTGRKPIGFRGPGFSCSRDLLEVLVGNRYTYDASNLPTFLGPLARAYYFWNSGLNGADKEQRNALYGNFRDGFKPIRPFFWAVGERYRLLEIPITTIPGIRTPFHMSYLLYLGSYSEGLMRAYLKAALVACRARGIEPSFLLHPLDFMGEDRISGLDFFPAMKLSTERKRELFKVVIEILRSRYHLVDMSTYAQAIQERGSLKIRTI